MKIKLICVMLAMTVGSVMWSCQKSEKNPEVVLEKNLLKSAEKYNALFEKRKSSSKGFSIEGIKRDGNILTIKVKGGCDQVNLVLHEKTAMDCSDGKEFDVKVNLSKVLGKHDAKDFTFNVANGSIKQDKSLNPDGSVTLK